MAADSTAAYCTGLQGNVERPIIACSRGHSGDQLESWACRGLHKGRPPHGQAYKGPTGVLKAGESPHQAKIAMQVRGRGAPLKGQRWACNIRALTGMPMPKVSRAHCRHCTDCHIRALTAVPMPKVRRLVVGTAQITTAQRHQGSRRTCRS